MAHHTFPPSRFRRAAACGAVFGTALLGASPAFAGQDELDPPSYDIDFVCDDEGAYLTVEVIDDDPYRYDVYIDDVLVIDFESDPDGTPWDFGPYADGTDLFVEIYWYADSESEIGVLLADGSTLLDCTPDDTGVPVSEAVITGAPSEDSGGSGPTLPRTGDGHTTLLVTGLALLAVGGALAATRRRPRSA